MGDIACSIQWNSTQHSTRINNLRLCRPKQSDTCWWNNNRVVQQIWLVQTGTHYLPILSTSCQGFSFTQGMIDLQVWPNKEADGRQPSTTPGKMKDHGKEQMQRLAKLAKKHRNGHVTKVSCVQAIFAITNRFFRWIGWIGLHLESLKW